MSENPVNPAGSAETPENNTQTPRPESAPATGSNDSTTVQSSTVPAAPTPASSAHTEPAHESAQGSAVEQVEALFAPIEPSQSGSTAQPEPTAAPQASGTVASTPQAPSVGAYGHNHGSQPGASQSRVGETPAFPSYGAGAFGQPQHTAPTTPLPGVVPPGGAGGHPAMGTVPDQSAPRRRGGLVLVAAVAVGALVGGASGAGISAWVMSQDQQQTPTAAGPATITVNDDDDINLVTAIASKASPSVVTLAVAGSSSAGSGSGVILSEDGYVLTNTHVVTLDGSTADPQIRVTDHTGRSYSAKLIGTAPVADLAVVKIDGASGLTPIEFGDSSDLNVGDTAVAIGAPLGLAGTVTTGIVSALNRGITVASAAAPDDNTNSNPDDGNGFRFDIPGQQQRSASGTIALSVIQTDAAINPGNSGGALVDDEGKLIGINVAIAGTGSSSQSAGNIGVGFSIPANYAKRVADELIADGTSSHGLLGASVGRAPTSSDASAPAGAYISGVTEGGAAAAVGLRAGDIVTGFNGAYISNATDLTAQVRMLPGGSSAEITFVRNGETRTVSVTLGELTR